MSLVRKISRALVNYARMVMPESRAFWAEGMANELNHIEDDGAALRWAIGSVMTAYLEKASAVFGSAPVRALLILPLLFEVMQAVFAQTMTLAWRLDAKGLLGVMGAQTPGDDYHRFIPLLQLVPDWYVVSGFVAGALVLASAVQLVRRRPSAVIFFIAGIVVGIVAEKLVHTIPSFNHAAQQVFHFKDERTMRDMVIPIATQLVPVFIACSLWLATRGTRPRAGTAG
jgi:hypothetical protein